MRLHRTPCKCWFSVQAEFERNAEGRAVRALGVTQADVAQSNGMIHILNGVLIVAAMSLTQATLTLPGIAGLILTFAVAVDANVLIYERMRDEARAGRSVIASMDAGFSKAWGTILDANVTTLVAAAIMFVFGAGPVRGFAWTLSIGVFTSVFSSVLVAQVLLAYWLKTAKPKKLPIAE